MKNPTLIRDPSLQRLVQDFDAVADLVQTLIERDRPGDMRDKTIPHQETEFTTEWQMEPTPEEVYSG